MKRAIYGVSSIKKPTKCTITVPPEQDVNVYLLRLVSTVVSIKDKTSKDAAIDRMENMVSDIQTALNNISQ